MLLVFWILLLTTPTFGTNSALKSLNVTEVDARHMSQLSVEVTCGNAYCPQDYPICCGGGHGYCVSGGDKCCSSVSGSGYTSCDQDELCCPFADPPLCCSKEHYCTSDGRCVQDECASITDPGNCVRQSSCGWCCEDHRCVPVNMGKSSLQCVVGDAIVGVGSQCSDICTYAGTCGECAQLSDCSWCCDSQSCSSTKYAMTSCNTYQRIDMVGNLSSSIALCDTCLGLGTGLFHESVTPFSQYGSIFAVVGCLCFLVAVATLVRYLLLRRMQADILREITVADIREAQINVRRYGFIAATQQSNATQTTNEALVVSQEIGLTCSKCGLRLQTLPLARCDESDVSPCELLASGDEYISYMPCGHSVCFACLRLPETTMIRLGLKTKNSSQENSETIGPGSSREMTDPGQQENSLLLPVSSAEKRVLTSKASEQAILKWTEKKCFVCNALAEDILQAIRVRKSLPSREA